MVRRTRPVGMEGNTSLDLAEKPNGFASNPNLASAVVERTGFIVKEKLFEYRYMAKDGRELPGTIYFSGTYDGKPAVLKVRGLKERDEADITALFEAQNRSNVIHVPKILLHEGWNEDRKYGFTVTELEDGKHIYDESKFATAEEMEDFCSFYNEFKTRAVTEPWEPRPGLAGTALERTRKTVEGWIRLSEAVGRLRPEDYQPYVDRYFAVMERHAAGTRLEFTHRELTAEQIIKTDGGYAITANILWGYMPEWADLSPNIWHSLLFVRSADATPERVIEYVDAWIDAYGRIPAAGKDPDFEKKIVLALLNRVVGTLTGDLGAGWQWGDGKPGRPYLKRTLVFEQRLFDHLEARLSGL